MSKFLIVPGLPKSGTTFLYSQLSSLTDNFNVPTDRKEVDYFRRGKNLDEYQNMFVTQSETNPYLDASPLYADDITQTCNNITQCLSGHELLFIFCLRNPFERMYSHYLHDVAQNFFIMGQARHSIYMPSVMSRYLYPIAPRIKYVMEMFGKDQALGFSFAADNEKMSEQLKAFASIDKHWNFDYSRNPAPGFTTPRVFYDENDDITVNINGNLHVLPARSLLIMNRQFSRLFRSIAPELGNNLMTSQSFTDRSFDGGVLEKTQRDLVWNDYREALDLLGMNIEIDESDIKFDSNVSSIVPEHIYGKLKKIGSLSSVIDDIYSEPTKCTDDAIVDCREPSTSLSTAMAKLGRAARGKDPEKLGTPHYLEYIVTNFGPSPHYLEKLFQYWLRTGKSELVISYLEKYPKGEGLFQPLQIRNYIDSFASQITDDDYQKIISLI